MKRENWNRMESIPIRELNDKQLKQAIDDWSEGCQPLKRLLWACYQNEVETAGCHSGHKRGVPYIDFRLDSSNREKLKHLIDAGFSIGNGQVLISFNGNPWSGPDWHRPTILLNPFEVKDSRRFLRTLCQSANKNEELQDDGIETLIKICEFLADKETPLIFRILFENHKYTLSAECGFNNRSWDCYTKLFARADMIQNVKKEWKGTRSSWAINVDGYEDFIKVLEKLYEVLLKNWDIKLPEEITEDMSDRAKALVMRRKFGTDRKGIEKMNKWLNENKEPGMRDVHY